MLTREAANTVYRRGQKPAAKRQYGWYVCPLLHEGRLVGCFEAHVVPARLFRHHARSIW